MKGPLAAAADRPVSLEERVLIVGPAWVGDAVMAQSLLLRLREQQPGITIDVLAPPWVAGVHERMPEVSQSLALPFGHGDLSLAARWRFGCRLRHHGYSRAYVLPNSWKSALIPFAARIRRRIGYIGEARYGLLNEPQKLDKQQLPTTVSRFAALAGPLRSSLDFPRPRLRCDPDQQHETLRQLDLDPGAGPVLALCPGAEYGPAKRWPAMHFAELARRTAALGWQVWLFGSARDEPAAREVAAAVAGGCRNLAGRTSLAQACDLLALAAAVVSNDSGLMHVAAALDRPLVCLYGSSDPTFTPPLSARARVVSQELACSPCFERVCPLGHTRCLTELSVDRVFAALPDAL